MIKLHIKNRFTDSIIFEYAKEDNTIKETVIELLKVFNGETIIEADFSGLDLSGISFDNSSFYNSSFYNSSFDNSRFDNSSFDNSSEIKSTCDLRGCLLNMTSFPNKRYIQVSCIGSLKRMTTYCFEDDIIWCGCFKGSLDEFESKVNETHKNNEKHLKEYLGFINYLKSLK